MVRTNVIEWSGTVPSMDSVRRRAARTSAPTERRPMTVPDLVRTSGPLINWRALHHPLDTDA